MWSQLAAMISGVLSPVMSATVGVAKKPCGPAVLAGRAVEGRSLGERAGDGAVRSAEPVDASCHGRDHDLGHPVAVEVGQHRRRLDGRCERLGPHDGVVRGPVGPDGPVEHGDDDLGHAVAGDVTDGGRRPRLRPVPVVCWTVTERLGEGRLERERRRRRRRRARPATLAPPPPPRPRPARPRPTEPVSSTRAHDHLSANPDLLPIGAPRSELTVPSEFPRAPASPGLEALGLTSSG